jgi:phosphoribosylformylglycinamidine synthase
MALAAIDECVRKLVCVGAEPDRIAILDNFCWPSCEKPENLGSLVRAAEGCYDGAKAYRTPFVSGKDSLNNQFKTEAGDVIEVPPTLLITGVGIVPDISRCVTSDAKRSGSVLVVVGETDGRMGGSLWMELHGGRDTLPGVDLDAGPRAARVVAGLIREGLVLSAHDCSEGGLLVAVAEMLIGGHRPDDPIGAELDLAEVCDDTTAAAFAETSGRYVLEVEPGALDRLAEVASDASWRRIGHVTDTGRLVWKIADLDTDLDTLTRVWRGTLDW